MIEKRTCPLGHECYGVIDGEIHRCMWHKKIAGTDSEGKQVDAYDCAIVWMPVLQLENSNTNRVQTNTVADLRDKLVARQDRAIDAMRNLDAKAINN